jgi:hypothetical protein
MAAATGRGVCLTAARAQLGTGTNAPEYDPVPLRFKGRARIIDIAGGSYHSLAVSK